MASDIAKLGVYARTVNHAVDVLNRDSIVSRIWQFDHTVWRDDPTEISNRLGWLTVNEEMRRQVPDLLDFAEQVRGSGTEHVVLLAMGGSALAPEIYRAIGGIAPGYPQFIMLDSTLPDRVQRVTNAIEPASTLFIVSSKSGETVEVVSLYRYFRALIESIVGRQNAGRHFVAITDEGTPLDELGKAESFRKVFLNPSNVGGRFSGLTLFGLVPGALMGLDLSGFLDAVDRIRDRCGPSTPVMANPGAWLGTIIGSLAQEGVDKLTLITSPTLSTFGLWVEQMLAESLGKESIGIIPIAGEPFGLTEHYDNDRLFVYLRLDGDDNATGDSHVEALQYLGHPTLRLEVHECADLGGELFRWAFATAVAGHLLKVHPFDQPNVQEAKDFTLERLEVYEREGRLPLVEVSKSFELLLSQAKPHDYLAMLVFLDQSPGVDRALAQLRHAVQSRYRITTTVAYGPRYLHSTGQLHKGGPPNGMFLQFVGESAFDLSIPGQIYSFGVLAAAQADGDISALQRTGRRVARCHLGRDPVVALQVLAKSISGWVIGSQGHSN